MVEHDFEVIDVHQHIECGVGLQGALDIGGTDADRQGEPDLEFRTRMASMDELRMRGAIVIAGNMYLRPNGLADTREVNDRVAAYQCREPERILGGVGLVEPVYGPAGFAEVKRCREELGLIGIGFHNGMQGVPIDSPLMIKLVEKIGEAGLVPFIHALGNELETIWQVDLLAKALPDVPMIVLDVFHDVSQVKSLPDIAQRRPNLYFDLSMSISFELMGLPQVRAVGADRFVYGTNFYSWPLMKRPMGQLLEQILAAELSTADKASILGGNAKRILGLR